VDQVAVRLVDLDDLEARVQGPPGGRGEVIGDTPDLLAAQLGRHRIWHIGDIQKFDGALSQSVLLNGPRTPPAREVGAGLNAEGP
jgi:hypothetical protein